MANAGHYISLPLSQTASAKTASEAVEAWLSPQLRSLCNNALLTILLGKSFTGRNLEAEKSSILRSF